MELSEFLKRNSMTFPFFWISMTLFFSPIFHDFPWQDFFPCPSMTVGTLFLVCSHLSFCLDANLVKFTGVFHKERQVISQETCISPSYWQQNDHPTCCRWTLPGEGHTYDNLLEPTVGRAHSIDVEMLQRKPGCSDWKLMSAFKSSSCSIMISLVARVCACIFAHACVCICKLIDINK